MRATYLPPEMASGPAATLGAPAAGGRPSASPPAALRSVTPPRQLVVRAATTGGAAEPPGAERQELINAVHQILGYARLLTAALRGRGEPQPLEDAENLERVARRALRLAQAGGDDEPAPASLRPSLLPRAEEAPPEGEGGAREAVLVVDDSRTNRDILCRVLRAHGYRAAAAEDGARALSLVARERFDAILLDVNMPGISGMGVLAALRGLRSAAELPVLMVTTQGGGEDIADSLRRGANDHVTKPIDFDVMLARLATQLALKRSREELSRLAAELSLRGEFIRKTFGRYLSDDVVSRLLATPEAQRLGGEAREVTILMTDVRSFTTMTENMPPEQVMALLNGYLGEMARILVARGGTIVEFIGDAVLAVFGAPFAAADDARRAVTCALEMELAMEEVNDRNAAAGLPPLEMAVAVHTGVVVIGNIGSEARTKYGVVGAQINLTARIESCAVGRQILISETTRAAAGPDLVLGERHELSVKGFQSRVVVHDLLGLGELLLPERRASLRPLGWDLRITCATVTGKRTDAEPREARMVALSLTGATLRLSPRPAAFTNLQLRLPGTLGEQLGGELHAKVVAVDPEAEDTVQVCFTSAPPGLPAIVQRLGAVG